MPAVGFLYCFYIIFTELFSWCQVPDIVVVLGTITTPFDMRVQNQIDRFNLVKDAIMHLPQLGNKGSYLIQKMNDKLVEHKQYIAEYGQDLEEIRNWEWHK